MSSGGSKEVPVVEQITVERAIELLQFHQKGTLQGSPVVTVIRDPNDLKNILSISLAEHSAFVRPGER